MEEKFFYENDIRVTNSAVKVVRWLIIVFPLLIILSLVGIFQSEIKNLIPLTVMGIVVTMGPTVASKMNTPIHVMKYLITLALGLLVALMATDPTIGIYMTYALPMVFSILYYDKKFTRNVAVIGYILLVVSLYFRSLNVMQVEFETNFVWFVSRSLGFALEAIVMSIVCIKIADVSHEMLLKFADTQKTADLVDECNKASEELGAVVEHLNECIHGFASTNEAITSSAQATLVDCSNNSEFADSVCDSMDELNQTVEVIVNNAAQMLDISKETTRKIQGYIELMEKTTDDMQIIEQSAQQTEQSIESLELGMKEVSEFATTIAGITKQTNLLALNASIEAARAGEMGKGFSVVAEEVRVLADDSKKASDAIARILEKIVSNLSEVRTSNQNNISNITRGIEKLHAVVVEAESIGELQSESGNKAQMVADSSANTIEHGTRVLEKVKHMQQLVDNTVEQANNIVRETENQKNVTGEVEKSFHKVNSVSDNLMKISKMN
ncbi:MAG: methyl-accepting chemotaxis protein [Lachnospiraceae bacterium]